MLRVNGAYLYELGTSLKAVGRLQEKDCTRADVLFDCLGAKEALIGFLFSSIFSNAFKTSATAATQLLKQLEELGPEIEPGIDWNEPVPSWKIGSVKSAFSKFEAVLTAELQGTALYFVSAKGGYDTQALTDFGESIFPPSLNEKVPEAVADIRAGTRCLGFELPTAAVFHFHRANEAVLRKYFDEVAGNINRPKSSNMGDYIKTMRDRKVGDEKVLSVLQSIKDLHRNPIMHPEESIGSIDDAINLLSAVRASIGYMLNRIGTSVPLVAADPALQDMK